MGFTCNALLKKRLIDEERRSAFKSIQILFLDEVISLMSFSLFLALLNLAKDSYRSDSLECLAYTMSLSEVRGYV